MKHPDDGDKLIGVVNIRTVRDVKRHLVMFDTIAASVLDDMTEAAVRAYGPHLESDLDWLKDQKGVAGCRQAFSRQLQLHGRAYSRDPEKPDAAPTGKGGARYGRETA
jgi:hypothetical protein